MASINAHIFDFGEDGNISTPIKGTIEVNDRDLTIDIDLGLLEP
jgi:hypothetical protein